MELIKWNSEPHRCDKAKGSRLYRTTWWLGSNVDSSTTSGGGGGGGLELVLATTLSQSRF